VRSGSAPTVTIHEPGRTPLHFVLCETVDVGRDCDGVLLTDAELSRRHLRVSAADDHVVVEDLGSTNGTTVDGVMLDGPTALHPGQVVSFGRCRLTVVPEPVSNRGTLTFRADSPSIEFLARRAAAEQFPPWVRAEGTVAVVFSDIDRWTSRVEQLGEARSSSVLRLHNGLVRRYVERCGGSVIAAHDDGFMLAFSRVIAAARFSLDVMRALAAHGRSLPADAVRIRIGMHCGEIGVGSSGVFGNPVLLSGWIASQATGGEVLASSLVRAIVGFSDAVTFGPTRYVPLGGDDDPYALHPITSSVRDG
jgi:class 3 adenylate cyclase